MLKRRIAAAIIVKDRLVVQSIGFSKYLPIGRLEIAVEFLNQWGIDEILIFDISATRKNKSPDYPLIKKAAQKCLVPLTIGGGITKLSQIEELMNSGADKISFNQSAIYNPKLLKDTSYKYGNQCVVASIDAALSSKSYKVYDYIQRKVINKNPGEFAHECEEYGAGEIFINAVHRDGSYEGFDIKLINEVCNSVSVPVTCCGGARHAKHFIEVLKNTNVASVAASNMYHFTEHSVNILKANVKKEIEVRLETHADYSESKFDNYFRLKKKDDRVLEEMLFIKIEKETI